MLWFLQCYLLLRESEAVSTSLKSGLSTQCWPKHVELFQQFGCARTGASYISGKSMPAGGGILEGNPHTDRSREPSDDPWEYDPVCTTRKVEKLETELCVYTSTTFAGGRGISIITTPELIETFTRLPIFKHPHPRDGLQHSKGLQITTTQSKGKGALAGSHFQAGDAVASNVPFILTLNGTMTGVTSRTEREELLRVAVLQLPASTRRSVLQMTPLKFRPDFYLGGILMNNAGFLMNRGDRQYYSLFPEMAFLNHDCAPKLVPYYSGMD